MKTYLAYWKVHPSPVLWLFEPALAMESACQSSDLLHERPVSITRGITTSWRRLAL